MSMFHELMMRKKEETLYPVIKGSLTESPEGVFSGFSASNYLKIPSFDRSKNWEQEFTFTTGTLTSSANEGIYTEDTTNVYKNRLNIYGNNLTIYMTSNGTAFDIANGVSIQNIFESNTKYSLKILFNGSAYKILLKTLNGEYTEIWSKNTNLVWTSNPQIVGLEYTHAFTGSIDLNRSYIKIDDTKYNLQAVVGYTVVGSPTITDGVVSGFSSSDYLTIPSFVSADNWEVNLKINATATNSGVCSSSSQFGILMRVTATKLYFFLSSNGTSNNLINGAETPFALNTDYWIRFKFTGTKYILEYSTDGTTYTVGYELDSSTKVYNHSTFRLGYCALVSQYFKGSIYLNETYIKVNNKLWFNGQQA